MAKLSVCMWCLFTVLMYHCFQVFFVLPYYDSCNSRSILIQKALNEKTSVKHQGLDLLLSNVESDKIASHEHTCVRLNVTYTLPKAPSFIIIGTQKGGTSALAALLDEHPWMESSHFFEPHFWDFNEIMLHYKLRLNEPEAVCKVYRTYIQKIFNIKRLRKNPHLLAFEKTPSYILTPQAPQRIKAVVPWAKIIVTLRNPVDRAISHHKMAVSRKWETRSLRQHLADDINVMRHEGYHVPHDDPFNTTYMTPLRANNLALLKYKLKGMLYRGCYSRQLIPWLAEYKLGENLLVIRYEELRNNPKKVLNDVLAFLGVPPFEFPEHAVNKSYSPVGRNWIEYHPDVDDEILDYMKRFYHHFNEELADLLGEDWRGVWD